ncbi:50S ribosomal protein L16 [Candidatus Woesearchaeota archaeon]|nr:MAG: 50S ribosomal protein L16 [Candidatus Woesearchaeota archaeon]
MAKLRKFVAYRRLERPYTRKSKYKAKQFVRSFPHVKIVRFEHGDRTKSYDKHLMLVAKESLQIRQEALESLRQTVNRYLEKNIGKNQYFFRLRVYPFHVLRENPLAAGAGADRMSTGMKKSFGKPIGIAAQVKTGKIICEAFVTKQNEEKAKIALERGSKKVPGSYSVKVEPHSGEIH